MKAPKKLSTLLRWIKIVVPLGPSIGRVLCILISSLKDKRESKVKYKKKGKKKEICSTWNNVKE
jgi:hypothetical protein